MYKLLLTIITILIINQSTTPLTINAIYNKDWESKIKPLLAQKYPTYKSYILSTTIIQLTIEGEGEFCINEMEVRSIFGGEVQAVIMLFAPAGELVDTYCNEIHSHRDGFVFIPKVYTVDGIYFNYRGLMGVVRLEFDV